MDFADLPEHLVVVLGQRLIRRCFFRQGSWPGDFFGRFSFIARVYILRKLLDDQISNAEA